MSTYSSIAPSRTPDWYKDVVFTSRSQLTLKRDDILTLRRLKTMHTNLQKAQARPYSNDHINSESNLRTFLHQLGLFDFHGKEKEIIKKSSILTDGTLTAIISSPTIPRDIRDVAQLLEARWWKGDTDPDLLRGVLRSKSSKAKTTTTASSLTSYTTYTLDPTYPYRIPADQIGHNGLHVGAWWPLQICAVRDGAHGDAEAGIHGHRDAGAFSIVVSGGGYANVDNGEMLEYCGTASSSKEMTPNTRLLITSYENKRPVRVLRSAKGDRRWSPSVGVRYDGLYVVTSWRVIDESVSLVRFTMVRSREQEGMRSEGLGRRPHPVEVEAVKRDREMRRVTV